MCSRCFLIPNSFKIHQKEDIGKILHVISLTSFTEDQLKVFWGENSINLKCKIKVCAKVQTSYGHHCRILDNQNFQKSCSASFFYWIFSVIDSDMLLRGIWQTGGFWLYSSFLNTKGCWIKSDLYRINSSPENFEMYEHFVKAFWHQLFKRQSLVCVILNAEG